MEDKLHQQIGLLEDAVTLFDAGREDQALNMAVRVRVLVHDTNKSTSCLTHYNIKDIDFYDTSNDIDLNNKLGCLGLSIHAISNDGVINEIPSLDDGPFCRKVSFSEWWEKEIFKDKYGNTFTRKDITLYLAHKEGGAHVSDDAETKYINLRYNNSSGFFYIDEHGEQKPYGNYIYIAMRQISHEVLKTLKNGYTCNNENVDNMTLMFGESLVENKYVLSAHSIVNEKKQPIVKSDKIGRNEPCPCGSGKKYKNCCIKTQRT